MVEVLSAGRNRRLERRGYVLFVLCAVYASTQVAEWIFAVLLQPIKMEFRLSDTELGFLSGISASIFYVVFAIPMGRLADVSIRKRVITLSLALFGVMTALCSLAASLGQLILIRIGVYLGEAGAIPAATSIIADLYPEKSRGTAMSLFSIGGFCGSFVAFAVGGLAAQKLGWRMALPIVALPGVLVAFIVQCSIREPRRGFYELRAQDSSARPAISEVLSFLWSQRSLRHLTIGVSLVFLCSSGFVVWLPSYFQRAYGMGLAETGFIIGGPLGVAAMLGMLMAGVISDQAGQRDVRWRAWIVALSLCISFPFCVITFASHSRMVAIGAFAVAATLNAFYVGPMFAFVQGLALPRMRAMALAILFGVLSIIGKGLGPQAVGILSDQLRLQFGANSLRYSLLALTPILIWAATHFYWMTIYLPGDLARARGEVQG